MLELNELAENIQTRDDLAKFVEVLRTDLNSNPDGWENSNLDDFLNALGAWVADMDGYYQNVGRTSPSVPEWKTFAEILLAAKIYE